MATGTVRSVDYLVNTSFATNTSGLIGADDAQDSAETLGALPISPNENAATGITSTPYVLQITDRGTIVEMNNSGANQVSVPTNASVAFPVGTVIAIALSAPSQAYAKKTTDCAWWIHLSRGESRRRTAHLVRIGVGFRSLRAPVA